MLISAVINCTIATILEAIAFGFGWLARSIGQYRLPAALTYLLTVLCWCCCLVIALIGISLIYYTDWADV